MPEEHSTPIVSRVDWRFLLCNPRPNKSIIFGTGSLVEAVRMFSDTVVEAGHNDDVNDCDLAVALDPNELTLREMFSSLKSGGDCYTEWNVTPYTKTQSIRNKLLKAGFEMIDSYMPKSYPAVNLPQIWIPIDSKEAINFLMEKACQSKTQPLSLRLKFLIRRFLWRLSPWLFINYPWLYSSGSGNIKICSLARKPVTDSEHAKPLSIGEKLCEVIGNQPRSDNTDDYHREIKLLMFNAGSNIRNKVILAIFKKNSYKPSLIIKIPRTNLSETSLANETQTLIEIQTKYKFNEGIPHVVFENRDLGYYAVGESFIDGPTMDTILSIDNSHNLAVKATSWLLDCANFTGTKPPMNWKDTFLEPLLHGLPIDFKNSLGENLIEQIQKRFRNLEIPMLICEQRDFSPWNILVGPNGKLGILDWESSKINGLPALDLIYFLSYLSFYIEDAWKSKKFIECYRSMLNHNTFIGSIFKECTDLYVSKLGISGESLVTLRIITWLTHLNSGLKNYKPANIEVEKLNRDTMNLHYILLKEELLTLE